MSTDRIRDRLLDIIRTAVLIIHGIYNILRPGKNPFTYGDPMKQKNYIFALLVFIVLLSVLFVLPSTAESSPEAPQLPHAFYGSIEAGGSPVNPGLSVEVVGPGVMSGVSGNPIITTTGAYGTPGPMGQKLLVQGDIEPGTPLEFYIGGAKAEIYPVATNGSWLEAYPYIPGEVTELNLRITSQPSVIETREPTSVQTRIPSGQVPVISGYSGPALPQIEVVATYQQVDVPVTQTQAGEQAEPGSSSQPEAQGGESSGTPAPGGQEAGNPSSVVPATGSGSSMLIGAAIVAFLVIIGAVAYYMRRRKPEDEKKEE